MWIEIINQGQRDQLQFRFYGLNENIQDVLLLRTYVIVSYASSCCFRSCALCLQVRAATFPLL